jgi:hypothetical protein
VTGESSSIICSLRIVLSLWKVKNQLDNPTHPESTWYTKQLLHTHTKPINHTHVPSHHWQTLYSLNHYTATHCTVTLGLTILRIFSRYGHLKAEVINYTPDNGHIGAWNMLRHLVGSLPFTMSTLQSHEHRICFVVFRCTVLGEFNSIICSILTKLIR